MKKETSDRIKNEAWDIIKSVGIQVLIVLATIVITKEPKT